MELSFEYFNDVGAIVADNKCFTFATDEPTRKFFRDNIWWHNLKKIPMKGVFRDLGAHLNLTLTKNGATLVKRIKSARNMCNKLKWMKLTKNNKNKVILSNIIPAALYGVETTYVSNAAINSLRAGVAEAIGPKSGKRSVNMVFNMTGTNKELDPLAYVLIKGLQK